MDAPEQRRARRRAGRDQYRRDEVTQARRSSLADALVDTVFEGQPYEKGRGLGGRELLGWKYEPLFSFRKIRGGKAHEVVAADFVTLDTGTGIVHIAPAFGEDDYRLAKQLGLGFLQLVEPDGTVRGRRWRLRGPHVCKEADKPIIRNLKERGLLFSQSSVPARLPLLPARPR